MLGELITSKTRLRLLVKFLYLKQTRDILTDWLMKWEINNSIRKELNHLFDAGYLISQKIIKLSMLNSSYPYINFEKIVYKHLGLEDIVDTVLKVGDVDQIIVIGDYAKGITQEILKL